jgi:hypothetical protein
MTAALPGPRYGHPTGGVEAIRGGVEVYRHYLSTRSEQYLRYA